MIKIQASQSKYAHDLSVQIEKMGAYWCNQRIKLSRDQCHMHTAKYKYLQIS